MHSSQHSSQRLAWLDTLRGIAACAVILAHICDKYWPSYAQYFQLGNFGVVLFFLCSGFVIPLSIEKTTLRQFWRRRFFRLYPLYWFSLALTLLLGVSDAYQPAAVLANATMLQALFGAPNVSSIYWSLGAEMLFYIVATTLAALKLGQATAPTLLALIAGQLLLTLSGLHYVAWLVGPLPFMYVGTMLYRRHTGAATRPRILMLLLAALIYARLNATLAWVLAQWAALLVFGLVYMARERIRWPRAAVGLGVVSYSLYLMHPFIVNLTRVPGGPLINITWWVTGTLALAAITYRWVERPAIAAGRRYPCNIAPVANVSSSER